MLKPCNTGVLLEFYDENPYRIIEQTSSGFLLSGEGAKRYKSHETGEIEENDEYIACAKVIAVGPKCENVNVGENVFCYKRLCTPIPYMRKKYFILSEQNITCRIITET